ncbi:recombinase family protein [Clostridium massiliamazoniense]|uniref:recombinase family protein n=1 Tax=Clostridium massiliamazoniense TaxID=1347366 RepID=UPI001FA7876A|nr:recombinase family protein [Clostridium massiliamazoniense]
MFNKYANGKGYKVITNQLNKLGYKTKKGNNFSVGSIRDILTNLVYIGKIRYNVR